MPKRKNGAEPRPAETHTQTPEPLPPTALWRPCDPDTLGFTTTDELPRLREVIGQPRAFRALELGSEISGEGYNIFAMGLPGSGRTTLIRDYLQRQAADRPAPDDWCYVNNFADPHQPRALRLPAGRSAELDQDLKALIARCEQAIPESFEREEYTRAREKIVSGLERTRESEFARLQAFASKFNFVIARTPFGFLLVPAVDGKPLKPEELERLSPETRKKYDELREKVEAEVKQTVDRVRKLEAEMHDQIHELDERTALFVVEHLVDELQAKYQKLPEVVDHLEAVQADIISNLAQFRRQEAAAPAEALGQLIERNLKQRYRLNILVDNARQQSAPVVVESHPSYHNLVGRIEHEMVMGASHTDFTMIRAGALHRANHGYLILPARDVLLNPYAWDGLKQALRDRCVRILELGSQLGLVSTVTLEPEPIPMDVKVVLIGTHVLYYMLSAYDEDFAKLFKVRAEFATLMDRTPETEHEYALFVKAVVDDNQLPPFDSTAVARVVEYGSRLVEDQGKLSTRFGMIADLIREAAYWARKEGTETVAAAAVERAVEERIYRNNLLDERIQELIADGTLLVDVAGQKVGQANALSVLALGDYAFGRPVRVTATVYPGREGVIDIEKQAELGGRIHTKSVLIISGFLTGRYSRSRPLNLSASLTFEQSYEEIEGDSASAVELFALLSAIADTPLRQDVAVTGSVDQHGQIQPVGGVNEKIEGFFAACRARGLTGTQGVILPAANRANLMLKREVIEAVSEGRFHLWPIHSVDQGLALLTGMDPGLPDELGQYPPGSFNERVARRLEELAQAARGEKEEDEEEET